MTVIMTRIVTLVLSSSFSCGCARTHALDEALDAGEEDCDQLPRRNLLEQHRAAAALEARLRARKGPAASYTHQEPHKKTSSGLLDEYRDRGKPAPAGVHVARQPTTSTNFFDQLLMCGHDSSPGEGRPPACAPAPRAAPPARA